MTQSCFKSTAVIPEMSFVLFSRCIVCRNKGGELAGIEEDDCEKAVKYLTA